VSNWFKEAVAIGSGVPDPNAHASTGAPVPQIGIENKPAPGQTGPRGMHGRTTYSHVNTGTPPTPDAGSSSQKSQPPRGLESLKMAQVETNMTTNYMRQPSLQDLIKVAMEGSSAKIDLSLETARQLANDGHQLPQGSVKTAAANPADVSVPTDLTTKLASACFYLAKEMNPKLAAIDLSAPTATGVGPGEGPGTLGVLVAKAEGDGSLEAGQSGKATASNQPPMNPPVIKDPTRPGPATSLQTNDTMQHPEQPVEPISNEKATLTNDTVKASSAYLNNLVACGLARVAMAADGSVSVVPSGEVEKVAILGQTFGAAEAPPGHRIHGAMAGGVGTGLGTAAGALGGGAIGAAGGGLGGAALGGLGGGILGSLGGPLGAAGGGLMGATLGGLGGAGLGGAAGAVGGGIYGRQRGYASAMSPLRELKKLQGQQAQAAPQPGMEVTAEAAPGAPTTPASAGGLLTRGSGRGSGIGGVLGGTAGAVAGAGLGPLGAVGGGILGHAAGSRIGQRVASGVSPTKQASAEALYTKNLASCGLTKAAEDAINPAQISSPKADATGATPPTGAAPSEEGVPAEPSDVGSQKQKMISSNQSAIDFTKRDAKGDPKTDLGDVLREPALSAATDTVLQQTVAHNNEAGSKISSMKLAAARALVTKLAAACAAAPVKKTKKAQGMGMTLGPPTPAMTGAQAVRTG